MFRRGHDEHAPQEHDPRAALWATLTLIAFPIVALSLGWLGMDPLQSFFLGALASLLVLLIEGATRGRWWMSDPAIAKILEDRALPLRLVVLVGILVLLFQSALLVGFLTSDVMDYPVLRFVLERECTGPNHPFFTRLCEQASKPLSQSTMDQPLAALRMTSERRMLKGPYVTCAVRRVMTDTDPSSEHLVGLVRCDRWVFGTLSQRPVSVESVQRAVAATVQVEQNGSYTARVWSDDPTSPEWESVMTPNIVSYENALTRIQNDERALRGLNTETFRRAVELFAGS
jgi:hypothetical protein